MNSISAQTIAEKLGGRRVGKNWICRCPAHNDKQPSLSITQAANGKLLVFCHAGCSQAAVISALNQLGLWTILKN